MFSANSRVTTVIQSIAGADVLKGLNEEALTEQISTDIQTHEETYSCQMSCTYRRTGLGESRSAFCLKVCHICTNFGNDSNLF